MSLLTKVADDLAKRGELTDRLPSGMSSQQGFSPILWWLLAVIGLGIAVGGGVLAQRWYSEQAAATPAAVVGAPTIAQVATPAIPQAASTANSTLVADEASSAVSGVKVAENAENAENEASAANAQNAARTNADNATVEAHEQTKAAEVLETGTAQAVVTAVPTTAVQKDEVVLPAPVVEAPVQPPSKSYVAVATQAPAPSVKPTAAVNANTRSAARVAPEVVAEPVGEMTIAPIQLNAQQQAEMHWQKAQKAMSAGQIEEARQQMQAALQAQPLRDDIRSQLAALLYGQRRVDAAIKVLEEGMAISPQNADFRLMLARVYLERGNDSQAYSYLKAFNPPVAQNIDYYATRAGLAHKQRQFHDAKESYRQLAAVDGNRARWWFGYGLALDQLSEREPARMAYQRASQLGQLPPASREFITQRLQALGAH